MEEFSASVSPLKILYNISMCRLMHGWHACRWSDGLHQAIEAKESVDINNETVTLASISYQNFFRAYPKLSGMSGTASTEIDEFSNIYNMSVQVRSYLLV